MTDLNTFGIDLNAFAAFGDDTLVTGSGTTTLRLDKRVPYTGTINGSTVPCYVTLREARLTRLSLLQQQQVSSGRDYWLATGILKPVKMDIELVIDGNTISLVDFLHHVANKATGKEIAREEFLMTSRRIGFNFEEGMPLFVQQFGASFEGFKAAVDAFKAGGAQDVIKNISNPGRIKAAYASTDGVPVTSFELGTVDRTKSPRNQGFENLVSAQIEQFTRILGLRKQSSLLKDQINTAKNLTQEKIKAIQGKADTLDKMSRQWVSSWSGAQQRIVNNNGVFSPEDQYDPVNAPCGRFTMVVGGNEVPVDLWSNSARANNVVLTPPEDDSF